MTRRPAWCQLIVDRVALSGKGRHEKIAFSCPGLLYSLLTNATPSSWFFSVALFGTSLYIGNVEEMTTKSTKLYG